jgi:nitroimidazol reductase NimA-like FMN-containing flavoprotein (pyridoxamine 5'-phosphate oxidase superfamily)
VIKVKDMAQGEMIALLLRVGFGHLGCTRDNHPYVVPMHYTYDSLNLYFFTTEGTKTDFISANSEICFQVEEITNPRRWRSVIVFGHAKTITKPEEMETALNLIFERNPTLTPALNNTKIGAWSRSNRVLVYRVSPSAIYGRKTIGEEV